MKGRFLAKLKQSISALLALVMVLALLPMSALAATAASSWKLQDAEGTDITAGDDGTISIPSETDTTDSKAKAKFKINTGDADTKNYYIFDKVDTDQYYILATVADTAITLVTDEAVKTTANIEDIALDAGVFTATLKNAANSATLAAGPSEADVIDFTITPPAAAVEDNKVTVGAPTTDESGKAEVSVELKDDALSGLISSAKQNDGNVEIEIPNSEAEDVQEVAVTLPDNLITEAKKDDSGVYNVGVVTPVGYVGLPVSELAAGTTISIKAEVTFEDNKIKGGIVLSMTQNGEAKTTFEVPVYVAFGFEGIGEMTNPIVAYKDGSKLVRTRSGIDMDDQDSSKRAGLHFRTRHFSEFVAVESEQAEADELVDKKPSDPLTHSFQIEEDETLVYVTKDADGVLTYSCQQASSPEMGDSLKTVEVSSQTASAYSQSFAVVGTVTWENGAPKVEQTDIIRQEIAIEETE